MFAILNAVAVCKVSLQQAAVPIVGELFQKKKRIVLLHEFSNRFVNA